MNRQTPPPHAQLLGFEQIERLAERAAQGAGGYPPCDIEQTATGGFRITLAVAGFPEEALSVTLHDRQLAVRGRQQPEADAGRVMLHRGIAARSFQRVFVLADGLEVGGARLEHGLLTIDLHRRAPAQIVQTIPISR